MLFKIVLFQIIYSFSHHFNMLQTKAITMVFTNGKRIKFNVCAQTRLNTRRLKLSASNFLTFYHGTTLYDLDATKKIL